MQRAFDDMPVEIPVAQIRTTVIAERERGIDAAGRIIDCDHARSYFDPGNPTPFQFRSLDHIAPWFFSRHSLDLRLSSASVLYDLSQDVAMGGQIASAFYIDMILELFVQAWQRVEGHRCDIVMFSVIVHVPAEECHWCRNQVGSRVY